MFHTARLHRCAAPAIHPIVNQTRILMRYPVKLETYSTISSCVASNDSASILHQYSSSSSSSPCWISNLQDQTLQTLRADPSQASIERVAHQLQSNLKNFASIKQLSVQQTMILLSLCYQIGVAPSDSLLSRCESLVPQLMNAANGSPQLLMQAICCYDFFAPHRVGTVLESARRSVENAAQSLRAAELAILICQYSNYEVFTNNNNNKLAGNSNQGDDDEEQQKQQQQRLSHQLFYETILERAVMICNDFSVHEIAQISLALAQLATTVSSASTSTSSKLSADVKDAIHHEFSQRFVQHQELTTLRDAADMLFSVAISELDSSPKVLSLIGEQQQKNNLDNKKSLNSNSMMTTSEKENNSSNTSSSSPLIRDVSEACARRLFLMLRDSDANTFAKILSSLSKVSLSTPRLLEDLGEISTKLDFSGLHPVAALDCLSSAAEMGLNKNDTNNNNKYNNIKNELSGGVVSSFDALFGRLTATMMSGKGEILRRDEAREKLMALVMMLK